MDEDMVCSIIGLSGSGGWICDKELGVNYGYHWVSLRT